MKQMMKSKYNFETGTFVNRALDLNGVYNIPIILLFLDKIKLLEKVLRKLDSDQLSDGQCINLVDWLNLAFTISAFVEILDLSSNILYLKIGGDGNRLIQNNGAVNIYFTYLIWENQFIHLFLFSLWQF